MDEIQQRMTFLPLYAVGQSAIVRQDYLAAMQIISRALDTKQDIAPLSNGTNDTDFWKGIAHAFFRLGWLYQEPGQDNQHAMEAYNRRADALGRLARTVDAIMHCTIVHVRSGHGHPG